MCIQEKDCHEKCTHCDEYMNLEDYCETLEIKCDSLEKEIESLREKNYELQRG